MYLFVINKTNSCEQSTAKQNPKQLVLQKRINKISIPEQSGTVPTQTLKWHLEIDFNTQ